MSSVDHIRAWHGELTVLRRDLHAHPVLGFEEHRTARFVCERLADFGIEHRAGVGGTGVVAVVPGRIDTRGRSIGLRADMDALPLQEENDFEHRSRYDGRMHACGHDGHTTMLLAAARYLQASRNFDGTAYLIFQPGEEGCAGAKAMIDDGLFERFPAEQVFALHNWPGLPPGKIGITPGPAMAAADRIEIVIDGHGGHGAHPHAAVDPVLVAGHIITAAQSIVSRNVSPIGGQVAEALVGADNVARDLDPSMGSEDFAFMLQARPGAFARLGQGGAAAGAFLHNSRYDFNDAVIPLGAGYLAALAERAMPIG